jgi:RND family efflux transporter MFP subunit
VVVAEIELRTVRPELTLLGDVEAYTEGDVHTEVRGLVEKFPVREGDFVNRGDLLARLNSSQLLLELEKTREERERRRVLYEKEEHEYERFRGLSKTSSVSAQETEKEKAESEGARFGLRSLDAQVRLLEDRVGKKNIKAPFDGYVVEEYVHIGKWVEAGEKIVRMVRIDPIYVTVPFPQKDLAHIKLGDEVSIHVEGLEGKALKGTISAILARGDRASRTFPVKVLLVNENHRLKPGMLAHATFRVGTPKKALTAPGDAIVINSGGNATIFLVKNGRAVPRSVTTGHATGSMVVIEGKGLEPGLTVVTLGNERLRPGQKVRIIRSTGPDRSPSRNKAHGR